MTDSFLNLYCANHPQQETSLRCNHCEKPICPKCAVLTPTGYRCKECVSGQQQKFNTAEWQDYPIALGAAALLAFLGSLFIPRFLLLAILVSPIAGAVIAESVRFLTRRRRSKQLFALTALAVLAGSLPLLLIALIRTILSISQFGVSGFSMFLSLLSYVIYASLTASAVYYRLAGIHIR
jgi:hypothetical protein